jgi:hypothetical protein
VPPEDQADLEATIHRALELGINHIETPALRLLRNATRVRPAPISREQLIVQTKVERTEYSDEFLKTFDRGLVQGSKTLRRTASAPPIPNRRIISDRASRATLDLICHLAKRLVVLFPRKTQGTRSEDFRVIR